jgi:hypothetical protein
VRERQTSGPHAFPFADNVRTVPSVTFMFANLLHHLLRRGSHEYDRAFVQEVRVHHRPPRSRRSEALLIACWLLIALKTWAMFWMVDHFRMPFDAWWIVAPTLLAAAICTWIYLRRE